MEDIDDEEFLEWHEEDQLTEKWEEDEQMEEFLEQKRVGRMCLASGGHANCTGVGSAWAHVSMKKD